MHTIWKKLANFKVIFWIYFVVILIASLHRFILGPEHYNNYIIFKSSFKNLLGGVNLYSFHPEQHFDLYKYSPTFAVFMAPFYFLPDGIGYTFWNLLNALLLFFGIKNLHVSDERKVFVLFFILIELITSIQNSQSNPLVAGLLIWTFINLENKKFLIGAILLSLATFIKIFPIVFCISFLFYGKQFWKPSLYLALSCLVLLIVPLLFSSVDTLFFQYWSWIDLLKTDVSHELNYSLKTFMQTFSGLSINNNLVLLFGLAGLLLPFFNKNIFSNNEAKLSYLALFLIWCVIYNHKAESPTFIIAFTGMAIYFSGFYNDKRITWFLVFAFVITSLSSTDLFPRFIKEEFIKPYRLKVLPSIIAWFWILIALVKPIFVKSDSKASEK